MSKTEKRPRKITPRDIAKDVLKLLNLKKVTPATGDYCQLSDETKDAIAPRDELYGWRHTPAIMPDLKSVIKLKSFRCDVCALGSMMVAYAYKYNDTPTQLYGYDRGETSVKLLSIFGEKQLNLIEAAFELRELYGELYDIAVSFGAQYKTERGRLIGICNNIIQHGEFRPDLATSKVKKK